MRQWGTSWFRAQERAYTVEHVLQNARSFNRPLVEGERAVGAFVLPPFQRPAVWTLGQKVKLIESFLDGLPVPPYVINRDLEEGYVYDRWLLDGQQRITAVVEFIAGEFPVRNIRFPEVCEADQWWFLSRPFHCLETELQDEDLLREIYQRLAFGGTPHQQAHFDP